MTQALACLADYLLIFIIRFSHLIAHLRSILIQCFITNPLRQRDTGDPSRLSASNGSEARMQKILRHLQIIKQSHNHVIISASLEEASVKSFIHGSTNIKHLSLTEFEGRTVSYRSLFFHVNLWPECEARAITGHLVSER